MSEARKLRNFLIQLRKRLDKQGITNKSKWTSFSSYSEMTAAQFTRRLNGMGIAISNKETVALWKLMQINSNVIKFDEFVKLIDGDLPQAHSNTVARSPEKENMKIDNQSALMQTLNSNRKALLLKFCERDPVIKGKILNDDFRAICEWFDSGVNLESQAIVNSIISKYDKESKGCFNYFTFLSDLCENDVDLLKVPSSPKKNVVFVAHTESSSPIKQLEPVIAVEPEIKTPEVPKREHRKRTRPNTSGIDDELLKRATYDDYSDEYTECEAEEVKPAIQTPTARTVLSTNGARSNLDPTIFPGLQHHRGSSSDSSPSGGRGKLDPAIFGMRPSTKGSYVEQPRQTADEIIGTEKLNGFTTDQILEIMAGCIFKTAKGSKEYYQRWRRSHDRLDTSDLRDGLAKDMKILIPFEDLDIIVKQYGGPMTLSTFVRMLSDGSRLTEQMKNIGGVRQATEDEAALIRLSQQVCGVGWEDMILNSTTAEDIVTGFADRGVKVTSGEIRTLTSKLGRTGLVSAIRARM